MKNNNMKISYWKHVVLSLAHPSLTGGNKLQWIWAKFETSSDAVMTSDAVTSAISIQSLQFYYKYPQEIFSSKNKTKTSWVNTV